MSERADGSEDICCPASSPPQSIAASVVAAAAPAAPFGAIGARLKVVAAGTEASLASPAKLESAPLSEAISPYEYMLLSQSINHLSDDMVAGFARIDEKFAGLEKRFDGGFARIDGGFARVEKRCDAGFTRVDWKLNAILGFCCTVVGAVLGGIALEYQKKPETPIVAGAAPKG